MPKGNQKYTPAEKDDMVRRVDKQRAKGLSIPAACKAEGVHKSLYQWWKAKRQGKQYAKRTSRPKRPPNERELRDIGKSISIAIQDAEGETGSPKPRARRTAPELYKCILELKRALIRLEDAYLREELEEEVHE